MCNCKDTNGFKQKLAEAKKLTDETGEVHVVYVHKATQTVFMRKETSLNDELKICCYFLPDGTEVEYTPEVSKQIKAKAKKQAKTDAKNQTAKAQNVEVAAETVSEETESPEE